MQVCLYVWISFVAHFFYLFFFILCRDAMNSMATVTIGHFHSWLCLDVSPSGQCMPGIRRWAVWESNVTGGGGIRTEQRQYMPSKYVTVYRTEPQILCWYKNTHLSLSSGLLRNFTLLDELRNVYQLFDQLLISGAC